MDKDTYKVRYCRYGRTYTDEFDSLEDAQIFVDGAEDNGHIFALEIIKPSGKKIDLKKEFFRGGIMEDKKEEYIWWSIIEEYPKIGKVTVAKLNSRIEIKGKKMEVSAIGSSKCNPQDEYDRDFGVALAYMRAMIVLNKKIEKLLLKETHKPSWRKDLLKNDFKFLTSGIVKYHSDSVGTPRITIYNKIGNFVAEINDYVSQVDSRTDFSKLNGKEIEIGIRVRK